MTAPWTMRSRFRKGLEPLLMLVVGAMVGTIVVLLYMPIFELASSMG